MIGNKKVIAIIPARGGSKGIKDKNIADLNGHPLIYYSIKTVLESKYVDDIVVSTDSERIRNIAIQCGAACPFLRPKELASDEAKTIYSVLHVVRKLDTQGSKYDVLILLQPTSPLRTAGDIDSAIELFEKKKQDVVSVCESKESPVLCRFISDNGTLKNLTGEQSTVRRQDMKLTYHVNGAIYVNDITKLTEETSFNDNPIPYIMPRNRSIDIDDYEDLELACFFMKRLS